MFESLYDWMDLAICLLYEVMAAGLPARKFLHNVGGLAVEGSDGVVLLVVGFGDFNLVVVLLLFLRDIVVLTR